MNWWDWVSVCSHSMGVLSGSFLLKTHVLLDLREIWLVLLFQYLPFCFLYSYSENSLIILASWDGQFCLNHLSHFLLISLSLYKDNLAFQSFKNSVFKVVFPTRFYLFPCIFPLFFLFCLYVYIHMCAKEHMHMRALMPMCTCLCEGQRSTSDVTPQKSCLLCWYCISHWPGAGRFS